MIYLTPVGMGPQQFKKYPPSRWGIIRNPRNITNTIPPGYKWCLDNDAFNEFDPDRFMKAITEYRENQKSCLFVVAPDVMGSAKKTLENYAHWYPIIKDLGWKVAFVAQPGQQYYHLPEKFDALFIGGGLAGSPRIADPLIKTAQRLGKWVHVGKINSEKAIKRYSILGVDSVDGTTITYGPDVHVPRLDRALKQKSLFGKEHDEDL